LNHQPKAPFLRKFSLFLQESKETTRNDMCQHHYTVKDHVRLCGIVIIQCNAIVHSKRRAVNQWKKPGHLRFFFRWPIEFHLQRRYQWISGDLDRDDCDTDIPMTLLSRKLYPPGGNPTRRHCFPLKFSFPWDVLPHIDTDMQCKIQFLFWADSQMLNYLHLTHFTLEKYPRKLLSLLNRWWYRKFAITIAMFELSNDIPRWHSDDDRKSSPIKSPETHLPDQEQVDRSVNDLN
jgi:hypothetical protein